jgi:hypothetical protein
MKREIDFSESDGHCIVIRDTFKISYDIADVKYIILDNDYRIIKFSIEKYYENMFKRQYKKIDISKKSMRYCNKILKTNKDKLLNNIIINYLRKNIKEDDIKN